MVRIYTISVDGNTYPVRERVEGYPVITTHKTPFWRWLKYQILNMWR